MVLGAGWVSYRNFGTGTCSRHAYGVPVTVIPPHPLVLVGFGQSNSECVSSARPVSPDRVYAHYKGVLYTYHDPMAGSNGRKSCVYGRLGTRLTVNRTDLSVVFATTGCAARSLQWLVDNLLDYLLATVRELQQRYGRVDAILFHQGESDRGGDAEAYRRNILKIQDAVKPVPMFVSVATVYGDNATDAALAAVQRTVGRYRGPDTDQLLGPAYRMDDNGHFNEAGLETLAKLWYDILVRHFAHDSRIIG